MTRATKASIELIPLDRPMIALLLDNAATVYPGCTVMPADLPVLRNVVALSRDFQEKNRIPADWGGFLAADAVSRRVIGTCSYKGPPAGDRAVEIAYFTLPGCEGKGYATAMSEQLIARAAATRRVQLVCAHTLPEKNASGRVLEKCGFVKVGERMDPEDGRVWRWERKVPA